MTLAVVGTVVNRLVKLDAVEHDPFALELRLQLPRCRRRGRHRGRVDADHRGRDRGAVHDLPVPRVAEHPGRGRRRRGRGRPAGRSGPGSSRSRTSSLPLLVVREIWLRSACAVGGAGVLFGWWFTFLAGAVLLGLDSDPSSYHEARLEDYREPRGRGAAHCRRVASRVDGARPDRTPGVTRHRATRRRERPRRGRSRRRRVSAMSDAPPPSPPPPPSAGGGGSHDPRSSSPLVSYWKLVVLERYAKFDGRSRRAEFWWYSLANFIVSVVLNLLVGSRSHLRRALRDLRARRADSRASPSAIRRLHDTDKSGWWLLIGLIPLVGIIVLIVFFATDGAARLRTSTGRRRSTRRADCYSARTMAASPWPPPPQSDAAPRPPPRRRSSSISVSTTRVPDMPIG